MYNHLPEALAIVDLAAVDPETADRIADECRTLTATAMVARSG